MRLGLVLIVFDKELRHHSRTVAAKVAFEMNLATVVFCSEPKRPRVLAALLGTGYEQKGRPVHQPGVYVPCQKSLLVFGRPCWV